MTESLWTPHYLNCISVFSEFSPQSWKHTIALCLYGIVLQFLFDGTNELTKCDDTPGHGKVMFMRIDRVCVEVADRGGI